MCEEWGALHYLIYAKVEKKTNTDKNVTISQYYLRLEIWQVFGRFYISIFYYANMLQLLFCGCLIA